MTLVGVNVSELPALLPRLTPQDREGGHRKPGRGSRSRPALSLPLLPEPARRDVTFGMGRLDAGGRITARASVTCLRWSPGDRIRFTIRNGLIIAATDPCGHRDLGENGLLRLPVAVRRACRLRVGDQILLAALPARQRLIIYPPATLATLTAELHDTVAGGEDR
nr:hypothetical protein GCM10020092_080390 [Actinoplanes digitatis]